MLVFKSDNFSQEGLIHSRRTDLHNTTDTRSREITLDQHAIDLRHLTAIAGQVDQVNTLTVFFNLESEITHFLACNFIFNFGNVF
ncbi:hypothetical protein D3C87_1582440 [compost metagenome]